MNLVDDLGNDLAIAFLVEKKYAKKLDTKESLALLSRIRETLRQVSLVEVGKPEVFLASRIAGMGDN